MKVLIVTLYLFAALTASTLLEGFTINSEELVKLNSLIRRVLGYYWRFSACAYCINAGLKRDAA